MGFSLEVSVPLVTDGTLGDVLAPAFGSGFFQPVAVGAIEWHSVGDHWFLAGYALERFLSMHLRVRLPTPASISLFTGQDAELNAYQQQCADAVRRTSPLDQRFSPFERVDAQLGATVLEPKHLTEDALVALTRWATRFPKATLYVFGAVSLALQKPEGAIWARLFQEVSSAGDGQWETPFLLLKLYLADPFVERRLVLRTQSYVWLQQAQALGGCVTPDDADTNLQALASFARTLAHGNQSKLRAPELSCDGRFYTREEPRLRAAFHDLLRAE
ncbi:hypothetical protein [Hyalangium versicolor]|uniref:hypothetical protein n=1 Tax=Hyalangium versicolor TaxID=2861190 RepID=UPI001CCA8E40|nr:hypothetical protein [Hyalangium versicolor]